MSSSAVVTRFAPSPTGTLHIGGARTALFNWLFARANGGQFLLRIEDTDRERSTQQASMAIFAGLNWLGLDYDAEAVSQASRADRHAEVALDMLARGQAYKCFATQDEIETFRTEARAEGRSTLYQSPWRDSPAEAHTNAPYVVRLKTPNTGTTIINDRVQGNVKIENTQLDDMILLRSDGTPVYMLAVVVDDFDMGVTHVIRGDDHLNNAARQMQIYHAMGWPLPVYAHIPLIHGPNGKKMSKRYGATGVSEYQALGYPAAAMRNYLARLGWSHGDDEFFTDAQAIEWFNLGGIGKSPARFDFKKLENISGRHIAHMDDDALIRDLLDFIDATDHAPLPTAYHARVKSALYCTKQSAKTLPSLIEKSRFAWAQRPLELDEKAQNAIDSVSHGILNQLTPRLNNVTWTRETLESILNQLAEENDVKFGKLAAPLRAALSGRTAAPSVFDMMLVLGPTETMARLSDM